MFWSKWLLLAAIFSSLVGCSSFSKWVNGDKDYRTSEAELVKALEVPPNLIQRSAPTNHLTQAVSPLNIEDVERVPSYQVDGVRVESNLVERWLVIEDMRSVEVWQAMAQFFQTQGYKLDQQRTDIGLMTTEYLARSEIAPVEQELGAISRLLNSWRAETVSGIYDRFSVQIVEQEQQVKVFFRHHMMAADSGDTGTSWALRPYDPMMESLALYRAMLFLGLTQADAIAQIETAVYYQENLDGEELAGLVLAASVAQSWDFLQSMIYRADWQVQSQNPALREVWVKTPSTAKKSQGFFSRLFGRDQLPGLVMLKLAAYESSNEQTLLTLAVESGHTPLNAEQRRNIFEALGLLTE